MSVFTIGLFETVFLIVICLLNVFVSIVSSVKHIADDCQHDKAERCHSPDHTSGVT